jgi:hypothetical protein
MYRHCKISALFKSIFASTGEAMSMDHPNAYITP